MENNHTETYHAELAADDQRWEAETELLAHLGGRRAILPFGGGHFRELANCKGCNSSITRPRAPEQIDRAELAAALALIP